VVDASLALLGVGAAEGGDVGGEGGDALPGAGVSEVGRDPGESGLAGGVEGRDGAQLGAVVVADEGGLADRGDGRIAELGLVDLEQLEAVAQGVEVLLDLLHDLPGLADDAGAGLEGGLEGD
jgi:hypothetical protein